ncbi:MAG: family 16 glycosylhydrolase [Prevotella sp.]|nr:family 16 glycosylhydrolase [Prevotella sp.]
MRKKIYALAAAVLIGVFLLPFGASASRKETEKISVALDRASISLYEGETFTLKPLVTGRGKYTVVWSSSDSSVASVKKGGIVTALKEGTADISVKIKDTSLKAVCRVNVAAKAPGPDGSRNIVMEGRTYSLVFEDDFDGDTLDSENWEKCPEQKRQDLNNYWDDGMSYLDGEGNLIIEMSYDRENDRFLSGGVRSRGKFEQAYGYFEIRCTVNTVPGYWTAFWLMGDSVVNETNGGRNGTEIDIMETPYFGKKQVQNTLNWDGYGYRHKSSGNVSDFDVYDGEYHTFALLWTEDEYVFCIDGKESWRTDAAEALGTCEVPLYMKITSETGSWTGTPDPEKLPDRMKIDRVRVYAPSGNKPQRKAE